MARAAPYGPSQIAVGHENGLRLRIYGEKAGLEWFQEQPNQLQYSVLGEAPRMITRGSESAGENASVASRIPGGHPEGFLEAFANLYKDFADQIEAARDNKVIDSLVPNVEDGVKGVEFVEKAVASSKNGSVWQSMD